MGSVDWISGVWVLWEIVYILYAAAYEKRVVTTPEWITAGAGVMFAFLILFAEFRTRRAADKELSDERVGREREKGDLKAQIERLYGFNQGTSQRFGQQLDRLAETKPEFKEEATKLKEELKAQDPSIPLRKSWLDRRITTPITEEPIYKAKLTMLFRNESDQPIYVQRPTWSGVGTQSPFGFGYAREVTKGEADWDENAKYDLPARVDAGWSVRLWIGLDPAIPDRELRKRFDRVQLGSLVIPVKVGNSEILKEYHL